MTVTYTSQVATQKLFGVFWKLLFRWRGSIYKLVWPELGLYCVLYYTLRFVYNYALSEPQRRTFEKISLHVQDFVNLIPLAFVLGFYVSIVMQRWWAQYLKMPWPDSLAVFVSTSIHGHDERGRMMRRTIMRYTNLAFVVTLTMISPQVKKRFPTLDHLVEAGFMNSNEKKIFEHLNEVNSHPKYWMSLVWAGSIVARARKEGRIRDDFAVKTIIDEINNFRSGLGGLLNYDTISIPLVYTQVVTLAVYSFFLSSLFGSQFLDPAQNYPKNYIDLYVPWFTLLQFFFYMGWLKVAETLLNPFGEDDDDFEVNWLVDRNLQVSYLIVDEMHNEHPELIQDMYWEEGMPVDLPYTVASEQFKSIPPQGSTSKIEVPESEQEFLPVVPEEINVIDEKDENYKEEEITLAYEGKNVVTHTTRPKSIASSRRSSETQRPTGVLTRILNKILPDDGRAMRKISGASRGSALGRIGSKRSFSTTVSPSMSTKLAMKRVESEGSDIFCISSESLHKIAEEK